MPGLIEPLAVVLKEYGIQKTRLPLDMSLWKSSQAPLIFLSFLVRPKFQRLGLQYRKCLYPQKRCFLDPGQLHAKLAADSETEVIVHPASHNDLASLEFPDSYTNERILEFQALRMLSFIP